MGKHMAVYAWGRQPWCMSAATCVLATCEHRCAQACALPKCMPRMANACGSCRRTGSRTHRGTLRPWAGQRCTPLHRRQHTCTQMRGEANPRLKAPWSGRNGSAQRQAKGSTSGGGWEAGAGTSAPAQMSTLARAGVPAASAHSGMCRKPPHTHGYAHIAQAQVTNLAPPPHPSSSAGCRVQHSTTGKKQGQPAGLGV